MKSGKVKRVYWGLILLASAVFIILKCIGIDMGFIGRLSVIDIVLSAIIISIMIGSIIELHFWAIPFELAVIFMLFEDEIARYVGLEDENIISNWLLLLCALLASIGIGLIINPFHKKKRQSDFKVVGGNNVKFGDDTRYIDCSTFETYSYSVKCGEGNIYFENTDKYKGNGVLNIGCTMGELNVHVPSSWHLITDVKNGAVNIEQPGIGNPDGPVLAIYGVNKLGEINIKFC